MPTTLNIDDDVLAAARALAERNGSSLGRALSELARRGLERAAMFRVPASAQPFTSEDVYGALSDRLRGPAVRPHTQVIVCRKEVGRESSVL